MGSYVLRASATTSLWIAPDAAAAVPHSGGRRVPAMGMYRDLKKGNRIAHL
jgi:hypothetical protein